MLAILSRGDELKKQLHGHGSYTDQPSIHMGSLLLTDII